MLLFINYNQEQNKYECYKTLPPNQDQIKGKCAAYWRQADFWAKEKGYGPLNTIADQLHVKKSYREKYFVIKKKIF